MNRSCGIPTDTPANEKAACQVHVILFVPADVKSPAGYQQRVDEFEGSAWTVQSNVVVDSHLDDPA